MLRKTFSARAIEPTSELVGSDASETGLLGVVRGYKPLVRTAAFSAGSFLASRGAIVVGVLVLASRLGPKLFGQFVLIQTTALLFTTFCALSFGQMATKIVAESGNVDRVRLSKSVSVSYGAALAASVVCGLAMIALSRILAVRAAGDASLTGAFALSSLIVLAGFVSTVQSGIALGLGAMRPIAIGNFIVAPVSVAVIALSARWANVTVALLGYILAQLLVVLAQEIVITRALKRGNVSRNFIDLESEDWRAVWTLGLPSSLAGTFTLPSMWVVLVLLAHIPNGSLEVGKFGIANQFRSLMILGVGAIANAALPDLATARAKLDSTEERRTAGRAFILVLVVTAIPAAILFVLGQPLLRIIGPGYPQAITELRLLAASTIATAFTSIYMRLATARDEAKWLVYSSATYAIVLVGVSAFAVKSGSVGVSWAILVASLFQLAAIAIGQDSRFRRD